MSYCGLVDARIGAPKKYLPVQQNLRIELVGAGLEVKISVECFKLIVFFFFHKHSIF